MKKQLLLCGVLVCILLLSAFVVKMTQYTPSEEDEVQGVNVEEESEDSFEMNDRSVLDAEDLKDVTIEKTYLRPVAEMLSGYPEYGDMYKDLLTFVDTMSKEDMSSVCYGETKFFASKIPIYYWNPMRGQVGRVETDVIVFTHDLNNALCYTMIHEDDKYISESIGDFDSYILQILKNNKNKKFVFSYDVLKQTDSPLMICEDNTIYGTAGNGDYAVKGDYFKCIEEIAVSYENLTNPRNLVEINIE